MVPYAVSLTSIVWSSCLVPMERLRMALAVEQFLLHKGFHPPTASLGVSTAPHERTVLARYFVHVRWFEEVRGDPQRPASRMVCAPKRHGKVSPWLQGEQLATQSRPSAPSLSTVPARLATRNVRRSPSSNGGVWCIVGYLWAHCHCTVTSDELVRVQHSIEIQPRSNRVQRAQGCVPGNSSFVPPRHRATAPPCHRVLEAVC